MGIMKKYPPFSLLRLSVEKGVAYYRDKGIGA